MTDQGNENNPIESELTPEVSPAITQRNNKPKSNFRNKRYSDAYGDYRGGYGPPSRPPFCGNQGPRGPPGPPLGFGPAPNFGPRFGPPPLMGSVYGPTPMWGRGYGPMGPMRRPSHEDNAAKYLIRCGMLRDVVKNLPRDFLALIEPQYCGLCTQEFDSFGMSRIHYISRNHLKKQKKWLLRKSDLARAKEPLKAREYYCELCDIQITSKVHADSHYSGKSHRSIVDSRKNPKNSMLLQKGMEKRLEQLIRREKKHLKNIPVESISIVHEKPKNTAELFCDICKTSVSSSDQMTAHLNGKRHLTKEKQHILNMMSGATPESKEQSENAVQANDGEANEENEGDGEQEDKFGWGNGDGNWEESDSKDGTQTDEVEGTLPVAETEGNDVGDEVDWGNWEEPNAKD